MINHITIIIVVYVEFQVSYGQLLKPNLAGVETCICLPSLGITTGTKNEN